MDHESEEKLPLTLSSKNDGISTMEGLQVGEDRGRRKEEREGGGGRESLSTPLLNRMSSLVQVRL